MAIVKKTDIELKAPTDEEIERLVNMSDEEIDFSDIPEIEEGQQFYRPLKQQINIRLDKDVIAHFKAEGRGYQTRINAILRNAMLSDKHEKRGKKNKHTNIKL